MTPGFLPVLFHLQEMCLFRVVCVTDILLYITVLLYKIIQV